MRASKHQFGSKELDSEEIHPDQIQIDGLQDIKIKPKNEYGMNAAYRSMRIQSQRIDKKLIKEGLEDFNLRPI